VRLRPRLGLARRPAGVAIEEERLHVHRRSPSLSDRRGPPMNGAPNRRGLSAEGSAVSARLHHRPAPQRRVRWATQCDAPAARFAEVGETIVIEAQCTHYAFDPGLACQAAVKPARGAHARCRGSRLERCRAQIDAVRRAVP
jgi:hypothetical protein